LGPSAGPINWTDNGTPRASVSSDASYHQTADPAFDYLIFAGSPALGTVISIVAFTAEPPSPLLTGYECSDLDGSDGNVMLEYGIDAFKDDNVSAESCQVSFDQIPAASGDHAIGTFSAAVNSPRSGPHDVRGTFDVAVTFLDDRL
jgi:hypothetical protein